MSEAIIFAKCLGFTDSTALGKQIVTPNPRDPDAGATQLIAVSNLTIEDGGLQKLPALVTTFTHSAPITNISAGNRFVYQDGIDTKEWDGTNQTTIGAILDGPVAHTPLDCRVTTGANVYKSTAVNSVAALATLGDISDIPPTSKPFYGMPAFTKSFVYNAKAYAINAADPRFLQFSEDYHYDVWNIGDGFIGHAAPLIDAGAIPGCILTMSATGVTAYVGSQPLDFKKQAYPCTPIANTLYSGFISKNLGYAHVFLCDDGVHTVTPDGEFKNLTEEVIDDLSTFNASYKCNTVTGGKYLAFGDLLCIEYDMQNKAVLFRATTSVASATVWNNETHYAIGGVVATATETIGEPEASIQFPYSDLGKSGMKSITDFYFTGIASAEFTITATDNAGLSWEVTVPELGTVYDYRIANVPRGRLGNHISFSISSPTGQFRLEKLRAIFNDTTRSR